MKAWSLSHQNSWLVTKKESGTIQLSNLGAVLCSASTGIASSMLVYPMDLLKKRMQVRQSIETEGFRGFALEARSIYSNKGFAGFYKGTILLNKLFSMSTI